MTKNTIACQKPTPTSVRANMTTTMTTMTKTHTANRDYVPGTIIVNADTILFAVGDEDFRKAGTDARFRRHAANIIANAIETVLSEVGIVDCIVVRSPDTSGAQYGTAEGAAIDAVMDRVFVEGGGDLSAAIEYLRDDE